MASFYGFGVAGLLNNPEYAMQKADIGLNSFTYAEYSSFWLMITFIPALLLCGPIVQTWPRVKTLGWCCFGWGIASVLHAYTKAMW